MRHPFFLTTTLCCLCVLNIVGFAMVLTKVTVHSVHPIYGVYPQKAFGCMPWDACKEDNKCQPLLLHHEITKD